MVWITAWAYALIELRLEQYPTAKLELPYHAGAGQQSHHRFELRSVNGPISPDNRSCSASRSSLNRMSALPPSLRRMISSLSRLKRTSVVRHGMLSQRMPSSIACLSSSQPKPDLALVSRNTGEAPLLAECVDLAPADPQAPGIHATGDQELGELPGDEAA